MTHLKKSLAMLLALIMMFSSMSVAASAWDPSEDASDITFTVKFFREDPKNPGSWIETEKAAPGEELKARVYIKTGFATHGGDMCFLFDNQYFSVSDYYAAALEPLTVNPAYAGPDSDDYGAGDYALEAKASYPWSGDDSRWRKDMDFIINNIEGDEDFFDTRDIISSNILYGSGVNNSPLVDTDWLFEYQVKVNDNTTTNTLDTQGEGKVPAYYKSSDDERSGQNLFIDIMKGKDGEYKNNSAYNLSMTYWEPEFYTNPATVTTTSEIIFDMGLVDDNGDWYEETYTTEKGIIGTEADLNAVANPTHPDEGKVFDYWSTQKPAEGVTQEKVTVISYDYDVQTLYAVWKDAPDVSYTLKEFYMDANGNYPADVEGVLKSARPSSTVSAEATEDERFTLDEEKSSFDVVVKADGSSVVNAYYKRNEYKLVYHFEDMLGEQTEEHSVVFGAELPAFVTNSTGKPEKPGFTFLGWTTTEGGTTVETLPDVMPTEDLYLYPVYEAHIVDFIFKSGEGAFADGSNVKRYSFGYSDDTTETDFEEPVAPGKNFVAWDNDIPETATESLTFEAMYEDIEYTVTFKADTDDDGEYETTVAVLDKAFVYGEKFLPEHAPKNYPSDAWELEDGTKVVFSENDDAYTVTGDVTLYTVGDDKYPARFYWSQEDLDNGAEPYDVIYVTFNTSVTVPTAPEKAGYTFIAWQPDVESGLVMDSTDGKDFVAVFDANEITVTFDPDGGECDVESDSATYGESIELPEVSKEGYELLGWYDPDGNKVGDPGDSYELPAEDITLTAKWEKIIVYSIITLDANGGKFSNGAPVYPVSAEVGVAFNAVPQNPTRDGYAFGGWLDENGNETSIPKYFPEKDVTIKAKWNELFDVTYYNEDGTEFEKYTDVGLEGTAVPVPEDEPKKDGHYFAGWVDKDGNEVTTLPAEDLKLYPKFEKNPTYSITYMDGDQVVNTVYYEEGAEIADYSLDNKEGNTFKGWNPSLPETMPAENLTVEAVWETNKNSITLDAGEGKFDNGESVFGETFDYGTDLTDKLPEDPEREGYTFIGWQDSEGNIVGLPETMPDNGISLTAKWEVNKYTITFDTDGGNDIAAKEYDFGATIGELPVPEKAGHVFAGWEWTNDKGEIIEACETMPAHDITVKATWDVAKHNINYYLADGGALYKTLSFAEGETIVHPDDPTVEGLTFSGWVDKDGNAVPENMVMGSENIDVYAKFDLNSYKVTYLVDGEVYAEYDVLYQAEVPVPVDPESSATRLFAGWSPAPESTMPAHDLTYTATWADPEPDKFTATFLRADGKTHAKHVLAEGEVIPIPEAPKKFGYVFVGWEPEVPETMPAEDMVFEPQYEIDKAFVTIVIGGTVVAGGIIAGSIANAAIITGISIVGGIIVIVGVAELVKHTHTVTYIVDGEVYKTYKVVEGTKIPVPADPAKDGFIFEGWNPEVPEKMGKEDLVFEATWTEKSDDDSADVDVEIPETGSVAGGLAAFAAISGAAAAAYVITRRKKED